MNTATKPPKAKTVDLVLLYLMPIIVTRGFGYVGFDPVTLKWLYFLLIPLLFIYVFNTMRSCIGKFDKYIKLLLLATVVSILMAYLVHNQSLTLGYRASAGFLYLLLYFFFKKSSFSENQIIRFIYFWGIVWIILWLIALLMAPMPVFTNPEEDISDQRGIFRFFIPGDYFLYMLFFLCVSQWTTTKKNIYLTLIVIVFIVIILQVTRQNILFCLLVSFYWIFKKVKHIWIYLVVSGCILFTLPIDMSKYPVLEALTTLTNDQMKDVQDDARIQEYEYFFTQYPNAPITIVLGNGFPHSDSSYGKVFENLKDYKRYYLSDVGIPAIYIIFGILGLYLFFRLTISVAKYNVGTNIRAWGKLYVVFLILVDIFSFQISVSILAMCLGLYSMQLKEST